MSKSCSVFLGPLFSCGLEFGPVAFVELSDFRHQRIVRVSISQKRRNGEKHFGDGEGRWPLILEDIKTNGPISVDVGVVNLGDEVAFWGAEGVVRWEVDVQEEHTSSIGTIIRADDSCLPMELVVLMRASRAVCWRILLKVSELFLYSFLGHLWFIKYNIRSRFKAEKRWRYLSEIIRSNDLHFEKILKNPHCVEKTTSCFLRLLIDQTSVLLQRKFKILAK